jgi:transposase
MNLKKNLAIEIQKNPNAEIFFFDESRFGTHSKIGHGWFKTGERTSLKTCLGFKNFYIYSAVGSLTGDNFHLVLPSVDTECMNAFLQEFSLHLENRNALLILDGAGWHKSQNLNIPQNIKFINLPAYSPELNPTEKLWEYIKNHTIKNKFYDCIEKLEKVVSEFIAGLTSEQIMQTCSCNYLTI